MLIIKKSLSSKLSDLFSWGTRTQYRVIGRNQHKSKFFKKPDFIGVSEILQATYIVLSNVKFVLSREKHGKNYAFPWLFLCIFAAVF